MGKQLTTHFNSDEFRCKCGCNKVKVDKFLLIRLEKMRIILRRPIRISSGYRCPEHNAKIGSPNSLHMEGKAVDISIKNALHLWQALNAAYQCNFQGIGVNKHFLHLDLRLANRCWTY